jgi:hypothetical protein
MGALEALLGELRACFSGCPDGRRGQNTQYGMVDIGMSAFSVFHMQSPSFLAHQRQLALVGHGKSNAESLYGVGKLPSDNHIRAMLDPVAPEHLHPVFHAAMTQLEQAPGGLDNFRRLGDHVLLALDGSQYHCSKTIHCPHCSSRMRGDGKREYFHGLLSVSLVAPGHDKVVPLEPEFISPQDGAEKQDCENAAAKRWFAAHGAHYARLKPVYLGDDLFSRQPLCEAVQAQGANFIFVCKPSSHPLIAEYVTGGELPCFTEVIKKGQAGKDGKTAKKTTTYRYRWITDVPLRDGKDALNVNWFELTLFDEKGKQTYLNSWVTDLPVDQTNVAEMAACGRARWKIENETFNVLKNNGYNLEHNFGHGKQHLAATLTTLNLLAFTLHTVCDIADRLWRQARAKLGPRYNFFNKLAGITTYLVFQSWEDLLLTLAFAKPPPDPP